MISIDEIVARPERIDALSRKERAALANTLAALQCRVAAASLSDLDDNGEDRLISVKEAAAMIAQDETWIYKHQARLAFVRKNGRSMRCSLKGVREYMRQSDAR